MIFHELFGQHLRLGNFLFKYAWSIAKKEQFGEVSAYPQEYYLWQYLRQPPLLKMNYSDTVPNSTFLKVNWEWSKEEELRVNNEVKKDRNCVVSLDSFFQSEKWFENYKWEVWKDLEPKIDYTQSLYKKYSGLWDKPLIGIGIRLGDFVGHGDFYQIPASWYILALNEYFPNWKTDYNVMIFSDDIVQAKQIFAGYEYDSFNYAEPNNTQTHADNFKHYHNDAAEQFFLGTLCQHFIIGNSTFSWWQAWLMEQRESYAHQRTSPKVIHSGKVFSETGNMKHVNTEHYYPGRWIKHDT